MLTNYTIGPTALTIYQKCHLLGSNQGPSDLQSDALPTELKRLLRIFEPGSSVKNQYSRPQYDPKSTSSGDRTHDHKIKSLALYHLSYGGLWLCGPAALDAGAGAEAQV